MNFEMDFELDSDGIESPQSSKRKSVPLATKRKAVELFTELQNISETAKQLGLRRQQEQSYIKNATKLWTHRYPLWDIDQVVEAVGENEENLGINENDVSSGEDDDLELELENLLIS